MLALLGKAYFTDAIMAAMDARRREEAFNVYVTDCFYGIYNALGGNAKKRFYDMLHPSDDEDEIEEETLGGDELAHKRLERFGIKVVD